MSGSELADGDVLVQIGAAFSATERFCSLLGYEEGTYHYSDKGMAAHGISAQQIAQAPRPSEVDAVFEAWLIAGLANRGYGTDAKRLVSVGFNVGGFDLPFVEKFLPRSYALLSRRVVDLNAFLMAYGASGRDFETSSPKWSGWKRLAVQYAAQEITKQSLDVARHDAGYDALEALYALEFLLAH